MGNLIDWDAEPFTINHPHTPENRDAQHAHNTVKILLMDKVQAEGHLGPAVHIGLFVTQ